MCNKLMMMMNWWWWWWWWWWWIVGLHLLAAVCYVCTLQSAVCIWWCFVAETKEAAAVPASTSSRPPVAALRVGVPGMTADMLNKKRETMMKRTTVREVTNGCDTQPRILYHKLAQISWTCVMLSCTSFFLFLFIYFFALLIVAYALILRVIFLSVLLFSVHSCFYLICLRR